MKSAGHGSSLFDMRRRQRERERASSAWEWPIPPWQLQSFPLWARATAAHCRVQGGKQLTAAELAIELGYLGRKARGCCAWSVPAPRRLTRGCWSPDREGRSRARLSGLDDAGIDISTVSVWSPTERQQPVSGCVQPPTYFPLPLRVRMLCSARKGCKTGRVWRPGLLDVGRKKH